jgi:selenide,water dikinase
VVGFEGAEDACVYALRDDLWAAASVDVITPLVDDPVSFGRIAVANALSDLYAMGADGTLALSYLALPTAVPEQVAAEILRGAGEHAMAHDCPVLGGHSVEAKELMFGLAVYGTLQPRELLRNNALRPGDALVLSKPLGTGTLTTAVKRGARAWSEVTEAVLGMEQTNRAAVAVLHAFEVRAATDVSGFGLGGHAAEMAAASGVRLTLVGELPAYKGARASLEAGFVTRANSRNAAYACELLGDPLEGEPLLFDPQTSGGLLVGIDVPRAPALVAALRDAGYPDAAIVGGAS